MRVLESLIFWGFLQCVRLFRWIFLELFGICLGSIGFGDLGFWDFGFLFPVFGCFEIPELDGNFGFFWGFIEVLRFFEGLIFFDFSDTFWE